MKSLPVLTERQLLYYGETPIAVDSPEWDDFLKREIHFKFIPKQQGSILLHNISLRCNPRSNANYWYAIRKVNNRIRQEYLGKNVNLTYENIVNTCHKLSLGDYEYWTLKNREKKERQANKKYSLDEFSKVLKLLSNKIDENYDGYTEKNAALLISDVLYLVTKLTN
ncbi:MAG: hypothetical protein HC836_35975 [Richelia sp. RM2_1_2]|nr:hypothetical protein [Richelia sp. RM2_1_2]